jgi:hypothetical protein
LLLRLVRHVVIAADAIRSVGHFAAQDSALEGGSVCRCAVCLEHDLDWQPEQWPQSVEDLLASDAAAQPLV